MMRIISGKARGVRLDTLSGEATRPTAERVKEALFSMLQFELQGARVLDLFGGSGQMALEALSRGAQSALICDSSKEAAEVIKRNIAKTRLQGAKVLCADWKMALESAAGERFDMIYLDPPYALGLIPRVLERIAALDIAADGCIIVCEDEREEPHALPGYTLRRHAKYGRIYLTVLEKTND